MKTLKIIAILATLTLISVGLTLATTLALAGLNTQTTIVNQPVASNQINSLQALAPITQTETQTPTLYTPPAQYFSPGYGTGWGWGGCMGGWGNRIFGIPTTTSTPLTISQAVEIADTYVASLNNPDLQVKQVEEYANNFYVIVEEKSTGNGEFELLINKATGIVSPEPGPNMMWNTKYTFGAGWCNWINGAVTATTPTVTVEQAKANAQQYLNSYISGTTVGDITAFNGHYTIEVLNNETPYGMLSVNSFTGQIWYHTWHGAFIQEQDVS